MFLGDGDDGGVGAERGAGGTEGGVGLDEDVVVLAELDELGLRELRVELDLAVGEGKEG